jgi:hypothetical protein
VATYAFGVAGDVKLAQGAATKEQQRREQVDRFSWKSSLLRYS